MRLPLAYSYRNLTRRPWRTGMTVVGVAIVVFASVMMLALSRGISRRLDVTGDASNLLMISRKGQNTMFSDISAEEVVDLLSMPGLAMGIDGRPLVSPELHHVSLVEVASGDVAVRAPADVRGVGPLAWEVHPGVRVTRGRLPEEPFEVLAGCTAHGKLSVPADALQPGTSIRFEGRDWAICGVFSDNGALTESQLWVADSDLLTVLRRRTHSFVVARFAGEAQARAAARLFAEPGAIERHFKGWGERDYYRQFTEALGWLLWLSLFLVAAVAGAGTLIGINTMYTAIVTRMSEIATLRVLGFKRRHIAVALLAESLLMAMLGGALGALAGLFVRDLPFKLSQGAFFLTVDAVVLAAAAGLSAFIGIAGALLPSISLLRLSILGAMRHA